MQKTTRCRAVIFDYIGTLVNAENYTMDASLKNLYNALTAQGFKLSEEKFLDAYAKAHEKYRLVRYQQLREVTNAVWVCETLNNLGYNTKADNKQVKAALNVFFKDYVDSLQLRLGAKKLLKHAKEQCKVGLISNFTYAPVIHASLRKLKISHLFNAVVVSQTCGWRKPSKQIFNVALERLQVRAEQAVYIGDSPIEDIKGAVEMGLKVVFVPSQFNTMKDLEDSGQKPNFVFKNLQEICSHFDEIVSCAP